MGEEFKYSHKTYEQAADLRKSTIDPTTNAPTFHTSCQPIHRVNKHVKGTDLWMWAREPHLTLYAYK